MRAAAALILLCSPTLAAAEPCRWQGPERLNLARRVLWFQRAFTCPAQAEGELRVHMAAPGAAKAFAEESRRVEPRGKWWRPATLTSKGFPNHYCTRDTPHTGESVLVGPPGDEQVVSRVPVRVHVRGTGDLASLGGDYHAHVYCPRCERPRGSIGFYAGRGMASTWTKETTVRATAKASWLECVRPHSTLEMRFFVGHDDTAAQNAIRPTYVWRNLHRLFRRDGDSYVLETQPPWAEVCKRARDARAVQWELWGDGPMAEMGGGGRSRLTLRCP